MKAEISPAIRGFEELKCWNACCALRSFIFEEVIPTLAKEERYRLGNHVLRAARSATANTAEGYGKFHYLDNAKFCRTARGFCWEVLDYLITASDEALIADNLVERGKELVGAAVRPLNGYMNYLKRAPPNYSPPSSREPSTDNQ